jgi:AcrR family transcriptional regulator
VPTPRRRRRLRTPEHFYAQGIDTDQTTAQTRPRRGRPRTLTNEQIVEAALRLANGQQLEAVSMRALAKELGVPVMTLYGYASSKEALFELVLDHVLRPVRIPTADEGPWDQRIRHLERDVRQRMAQNPGLSLSRHGHAGPEAIRLAEGVLTILDEGGFTPHDAARAFSALFTFMLGQVEVDALTGTAIGPDPMLADATRAADLTRDALFEFGFDALIEGLKAMLSKT